MNREPTETEKSIRYWEEVFKENVKKLIADMNQDD